MAKRRLIDLDEIKPIDFPSIEMDGLDAVRYLNTLPTVDAVEVVRCKDCKHQDEYGDCDIHDDWFTRKPDSFCCYGERKSDG
jgi:hypothetical protein